MAALLAFITILLVLLTISLSRRSKFRDVSSLPAPGEDVQSLISAGKKVAAIQAYRKQTGASLLEATQVITRHAT